MKKLIAASGIAMACAFAFGACSSSSELPEGWEGGARVSNFVQQACSGGERDFDERATFVGGPGSIGVDYQDAHFRCAQDVEGFFKQTGNAIDILVQPKDMDPSATAGCDCGYHITFAVEPLAAGPVQTTLYRRWDNINHPNDPVSIATAQVTVE